MNVVAVRELNKTEARALTERIKAQAEHLWRLLLEAHEGKAWKALGYTRWSDYISGEFHRTRSWSYQLLDQAHVIRAIEGAAPSMSTRVDIDEKTARDIKPLLPVVVDDIKDRIARGQEPEEAVRETVTAARQTVRAQAPARTGRAWTRDAGNADKQVAKIIQGLSVVAESIVAFDPGDYRATPEEVEGLDRIIKALRQFRKALAGE